MILHECLYYFHTSPKLFFKQGFSSLFDYVVRELGYSEGAAYRRIKAMKLCCALPETANRLQSGRLSLSAASQLQVFFEKQDKKIKEEAKIVIDEKCHKDLEKLKNLLSHKNPNLSYGELISILSKEALKKYDPGEKSTRQRKEDKIQENLSVKKKEFKDKSVELAVTSASKLRQTDQYSKEKATSAPKSGHGIKKLSRSISSHFKEIHLGERQRPMHLCSS